MSNIRTKNILTGLFAIILLVVSTCSVLAPALMPSSGHPGTARAVSTIGNTIVGNRAVVFSPPHFVSMANEATPYVPPLNSIVALQLPLSADFSFPTYSVAVGPVTASTGSPLAFNATVSGGSPPYAYDWNFKDGSLGTGSSLSHIFSVAGVYNVTLAVHDSTASSVIASHLVNVVLASAVDFSYLIASVNSPVAFNATPGFSQYYWDFGDGTYSVGSPASHTYSRSGTYFVLLSAYNNTGVYSTASHLIVIGSSVVAVDFSFPTYSVAVGPVTASSGSPVAFNATATGGVSPYTLNWNFDDGSLAVGNSPTHTFTSPGTYIVVLTATDSSNVKATASRFVLVQSAPRLDFVSYSTVTAGSPTVFNTTTPGFSAYYWDFGDGTTYSVGSPASHTYSRSGTYFVLLSAYNNTGVYSTASHVLVVGSGVVLADFVYPTNSVAAGTVYPSAGSPVVFNATATGGVSPYSFAWNFGDGLASTGSTLTHVFSIAGTYTVVLTVSDAIGAHAVASRFVLVRSAPRVDFVSYPTTVGSPTVFNTTTPGFSAYYWDFGDGTTYSVGSPASHTYSRSGTYFVLLSAYNNTGVYSTASHVLVVGSSPIAADFVFPTNNLEVGAVTATTGGPVAFNVTATGGVSPYSFAWNFGDGSVATGGSPTHAFTSPGTYIVVLTATDSSNVKATVSHFVVVQSAPKLDFVYPSVTAGSPATFNGTLGFYYYYWDFGDGTGYYSSSNGAFASHTYSRSGTYFVVLSAYNNTGVYSTASHVPVVASTPVTADFSFPTSNAAYGSVTASAGSPLAFNVTIVSGGVSPYTLSWNFGDGSTGTGSHVGHTFSARGFYIVILTVTDSVGAHLTTSHFVVVQSPGYTVDLVSSQAFTGSPALFNATQGLYYYAWDFGDGVTYFNYGSSNGFFATHTYARSGTYFVVLTTSTSAGVIATVSHIVVVASTPVTAEFSLPTRNAAYGSVTANAGSPLVFNATATGGSSPYHFVWTLGNGSTAVGRLPTHIFALPGSYIVILTVTDSQGNVAVASHIVTVDSSPYLVDFTYPQVAAGSIVAFSGTSGFYLYYWDFGDGSTYQDYGSNGASIAYHAYSSAGPFIVVMTVSDSLGTATASHGFSTALVSDFTVSPTIVAAGHPVTFNVTSTQGGTPPYTFVWNFGDGTTGSGTSPIHSYSKPGTFIIVLEITDSSAPSANSLTIAHSVTVVDFEITATPITLSAIPGQSSNSTISLASKLGFTSPVVLTVAISQPGLTCTITPGTVTLGTSAIATLSCKGSVVTSFTVTVTGSASSGSHSVTITFYVTDFSISANPTTITFDNGSSGNSTVYVSSINGFSDPVTLSSTVSPSGFACTLVPTIVTPPGGYYTTSTLSCSSLIAGTFSVNVTGSSQSLTHFILLTVNVLLVNFDVSASPNTLTIVSGSSANSTITLGVINGFTGIVTLSATISPSGPNVSLADSSLILRTTNSTVLIVSTGLGGAQDYTVTVTGVSGLLSHSVTIIVHIQDFATSANQVTIVPGASGTSNIVVYSLNGFTGNVTLTATSSHGSANGITLSLSTEKVSVPSSSSGHSILTITTLTSTPSGLYNITITGTIGTLSHTTILTVQVSTPSPEFAIIAYPTVITANVGTIANSTITISPLNGFTNAVTLSMSITPSSGLSCTLLPGSITGGSGSSALSCTGSLGNYAVTVTGTSGTLSHYATVTFTITAQDFTITGSPTSVTVNVGKAGNLTISLGSVNGFADVVNLTADTSGCILDPTTLIGSGSSKLSCTFASPGSFTVTVTGTSTSPSLSHSVTVNYSVGVPDFAITTVPITIAVNAGIAAQSIITVSQVNGFTGNVTLTSSISPSTGGLTCTLTMTSVLLGGSGTSILSCYGSAGVYSVTVTGTNGLLSHGATIIYTVQDFRISANPTSVNADVNQPAASTITITGLDFFHGIVTLSADNAACTLTTTVITGSGTSTLTCTFTSLGSFNVVVTGNSDTLSRLITVAYVVAVSGFTTIGISCDITVVVNQASLCTATVTDTATTGATSPTGTVTFALNPSPGGGTFDSSICTLAAGTTGVSSCSVHFTGSGPGGDIVNLVASYAGDTTHASSTSTVLSFGVLGRSTTTTVTCDSPVIVVTPSVCHVITTDTSAGTPITPTGDFALTASSSGTFDHNCILGGTGATATCTVTYTPTATGSHTITATYPQNSVDSYNTPGVFPITVNPALLHTTTTTVACTSPVVINIGSTCTISVTDTSTGAFITPTGTVALTETTVSGQFTTCTLAGTTATATCTSTFTATTAGAVVPTANYPGDTSHSSSVGIGSILVDPRATSTTIGCTTPVVINQGSTCNVTVTDTSPGTFVAPNGTLTLSQTGVTGAFTTCKLAGTTVSTTCTSTFTARTSGTAAVTASYPGDISHAISSGTTSIVVNLRTTATTVSCTTPVTINHASTCSVTVTDNFPGTSISPTGTFALTTDSTGTFSSSCLLAGTGAAASCTVSYTPTIVGGHRITANYPGDVTVHSSSSGFSDITATNLPVVVITTTLSASTIDLAGSVTDFATLTGVTSTAGGSVTYNLFTTGNCAGTSTVVSTVTVVNGVVPNSASQTFNTAGQYGWNAVYTGDLNNAGATSSCEFLTVNRASPTITTSLSATQMTVGGSVFDSATMTGGFQAGGLLGYNLFPNANCKEPASTLVSLVTVTNGVIPNSAPHVFNTAGSFSWNVSYSGDVNNNPATSACEPLTVSAPVLRTTTTTVTCVPASINFGSMTTCTALVNDTDTGTGIVPTGTVTFSSSGTGTFVGSPCTISRPPGFTVPIATCQVTYTPTGNAARTDAITGSYSGDASHTISTGTVTVNVQIVPLHPTTTTVSCAPNPVTIGQLSSCTATVTDTFTTPTTPTGTVSFTPGGVCTLAGVSSSSAACSISLIPVASGTIAISASYSGDTTHSISSGNTDLATSLRVPTVTVACIPSSVTVNRATTCTATVADQVAGTTSIPTGTLTFTPGGTCTLSHSSNDPNPESTCSVNITPTTTGQLSITATYGGDSTHSSNQATITISVIPAVLNSTSTTVSCSPNTVNVGSQTTCTANVADTSNTPTTPTGTVTFVSDSSGGFSSSGSCALLASITGAASCSVTYTANSVGTGTHNITGSYSGDSTHAASSGIFQLKVTQPSGQAVQLTFQGFDLDDFDNGVGQLQVLVNGHLVVDIPAGLNHLTGTGDYRPYADKWVNFGPFDITNFVVQGQNTIVFLSPAPGHSGSVKNILVKGNTVLLQVRGASPVSLHRSATFTFSNPSLTVTGFNAASTNPRQNQVFTFTASYTGGTGPIKCIFRFGDGESITVTASGGVCSTTHSYDDSGTFRATVTIIGSSTSDVVSATLIVRVAGGSNR